MANDQSSTDGSKNSELLGVNLVGVTVNDNDNDNDNAEFGYINITHFFFFFTFFCGKQN